MDLLNYHEEEWRVIPFAPNYAVSDRGRLKRITGGMGTRPRILKTEALDRYGYVKAKVFAEGRRIHTTINRLMAFAFFGEPPTPDHQSAHWDGIRTNNVISNLRWATPRENYDDSIRLGTMKGERNAAAKLVRAQVDAIRKERSGGRSLRQIARAFGVSKRLVQKITRGELWNH